MAHILKVARARLQEIERESESVYDFISSGQSFISNLKKNKGALQGASTDLQCIEEVVKPLLERAHTRLGSCLEEARVLGEFIEYGKSLEESVTGDLRGNRRRTLSADPGDLERDHLHHDYPGPGIREPDDLERGNAGS